ncbi:HlyD family secretion protein [Dyella sp. GSA-30]|uniref:HlyD family secretion protein n=1 Tax=Dyella sp. GSA-30 TaxID=2994496 RepID=UPI002490299F|nr:HlyD family secretion protein [Dyella sp. GSA-30]BDU21594.1 hypothetical protein DYGSA30_30510 [Dyella sp. GSA-30]
MPLEQRLCFSRAQALTLGKGFTFALGFVAIQAHAVIFTGEVRASEAQPIFAPLSSSSPVVLRYFLPDGTVVKPGDVLLRIDAAAPAAEIRKLDETIDELKAKIVKEVAELRLKEFDAELATIDARAAFDAAKVDAGLPKSLLSGLDYDRYQAELTRANRDLELKQQQQANAREAVDRRQNDGKLELEEYRVQRDHDQAEVDAAEVHATRAGVFIHEFSSRLGNGSRFEEGSSSFPGQQIGEIVGAGTMQVRAYVIESDRAELAVGQRLHLHFDALPRVDASGLLTSISGAPQTRSEWGDGRYFTVDIGLDASKLPLRPGMSVRVDSSKTNETTSAVSRMDDSPKTIHADGELYALDRGTVLPPFVEDLWPLTITQIASDGQLVKRGDPILSYDGRDVMKRLVSRQGELEEKRREQERIRLDLAERARNEALATASAQAEVIKAQRKANLPEAAMPGIVYKKLWIERGRVEQRFSVIARREQAATAERAAEQHLIDAAVMRLDNDIARLQAIVVNLNVTAQRDGVFQRGANWNGEKFDVGSQIWNGQSVGQIPDMSALAVHATLTERDLSRVRQGDAVIVTLEGGSGQSAMGHIEDIGLAVHSKSSVDPVPVVDLRISLAPTKMVLKPDQPVGVEIQPHVVESSTPTP